MRMLTTLYHAKNDHRWVTKRSPSPQLWLRFCYNRDWTLESCAASEAPDAEALLVMFEQHDLGNFDWDPAAHRMRGGSQMRLSADEANAIVDLLPSSKAAAWYPCPLQEKSWHNAAINLC